MKWVTRSLLVLLVVLVVTALGLWFASNRSDAGRMRGSIEIARPAEVVWPWMTDAARLPQWVGWLEAVESDSTGPAEGIGHRETWVMNDPRMKEKLRVPGTITLWEPPYQMGVHVELPGMFTGDVFYSSPTWATAARASSRTGDSATRASSPSSWSPWSRPTRCASWWPT